MAIQQDLTRLGHAARRLNDGSDHINRLITEIDKVLSRLMIGMDYMHPAPVLEQLISDEEGARIIDLHYLGYFKVTDGWHLAIKTVRVFESKAALGSEPAGDIIPLLAASRQVRHAAVDCLPAMVHGLATQVEEVVGSLERRCATAESLLADLRSVEDAGNDSDFP